LAAVQGNNEVGLWNIESQHRQLVLWASSMPILVTDQKVGHFEISLWNLFLNILISYFQHNSFSQSISALHSIQQPDMNVVLTAGTDMRIRYWNLSAPQESYIVAGGSNEVINPSLVSYK
jgi:phosphoinositide-3-kinase regulatory subunit 4